jgi:UDP-N-acetylmuramoyl-tripeptide--D-alanyl-D-alanine ligase
VSDPAAPFSATAEEVAEICGGRVRGEPQGIRVSGVATDSREINPGELFIALTGEQHDGHEFLAAARDAGAAAAVVSRPDEAPQGLPLIVVADTLEALGAIAGAHRAAMQARVVAITGSTGKTSTKDMLGRIVQSVGASVVAAGTQNNEIGVPLTLLRLRSEHRFCVVELAMRGEGEIDYLAAIARPDVGVITNIGQSHVGRLGSREAIAQAKAEVLAHIASGGAAVLNADDFFFSVFSAMASSEVISFGTNPAAQYRAEQIEDGGIDAVRFRLVSPEGAVDVAMNVPGRHNVLNALAAAAAAGALGVSVENVAAALDGYEGSPMRMQRVEGRHGSLIINDAYNASPDSVEAALEVLSSTAGRKLFVFGDMLEMGPEAEEAHREIGRRIAAAGVERLVAVGELSHLAAAEAEALGLQVDVVADAVEVAQLLGPELRQGDVLLVKGSRGMALERVVEALSDDN